jgi:hypothetical protein
MKRILATVAVVLALVFSTISLLVNGVLLYGLLQARQAGLEAVAAARTALSGLNDRVIEASVPLHHALPIEAIVPVQQDLIVPIHTTLPFSTTVSVPVDLPIVGEYRLSVPVQAEVPVDLEVVVPLSQTVRVETVVQVDTEVPVQVEMRQLGIDDLIAQIDEALAAMERKLQNPLSP